MGVSFGLIHPAEGIVCAIYVRAIERSMILYGGEVLRAKQLEALEAFYDELTGPMEAACCLAAMAHLSTSTASLKRWKDDVVQRLRGGLVWREAVYPPYKAHRRHTQEVAPHIINKGCNPATTPSLETLQQESE